MRFTSSASRQSSSRERVDGGPGGHRRRVRHHDIEPAESRDRRLHPGPYRGGIAHVAVRGARPAAGGAELRGDRLRRASVYVEALHRGALRRERPGDRRADSAAPRPRFTATLSSSLRMVPSRLSYCVFSTNCPSWIGIAGPQVGLAQRNPTWNVARRVGWMSGYAFG